MLIERTCPITGKIKNMDIPVTQAQISAWKSGTLIQNAMPNLSDDEREFILTGITHDVWDQLFSEE